MNGDLVNFFGTSTGFDTHSVEPQKDFDVIPPGDYPIEIEKSEMKPTKKVDANGSPVGHYLELTCKILALPGNATGMVGQTAVGRKVWDRLNIDNPSQVAVEIALRSLAALGQALGLANITDTQQVVGGKCIACIKAKDDNNEIRTYKPLATALVEAPPAAPNGPTPGGPNGPVAPQQPMVPPPPAPMTAPVQLQPAPGYVPDVAGLCPPVAGQPEAPVAPAATAPVTAAPATAAPPRPWEGPSPR